MMSLATATPLQTLRAHRPRLVLIMLAFSARLLLAGCAVTPTGLTETQAVEALPAPEGVSGAAEPTPESVPVTAPTDEKSQAPVPSSYAEPASTDDYDPDHDLIPGC